MIGDKGLEQHTSQEKLKGRRAFWREVAIHTWMAVIIGVIHAPMIFLIEHTISIEHTIDLLPKITYLLLA
jgi:hypothetical protein